MTVRRNPWTTERVERLTALAAEGATGSEIAAEFGTTRNAVIGKIHRMIAAGTFAAWSGAAGRLRNRQTKGTENSTARRRSRKFKFNFARPSMLMPVAVSPRGEHKPRPTPSNPCALVELRADSCRWPLWDDLNTAERPVLFCNEWAAEGYPYCEGHCLVAYRPVRERDAA